MVTRDAKTVSGMVTMVVTVVVVVAAALVGTVEGIDRGPAARENRMKNLKSSNVDLKALREKYKDRVAVPCSVYEPSPTDPPLPTVPLSFMTQVEFTFLEEKLQRVIHGVEMYDSPSRRGVNDYDLAAGVVLTRPFLVREEIHYNHNLDEALFILTQDPCSVTGEEDCDASKYCSAGKIDDLNAEMQELFGIVDTSGGEEFMGAMGLMQFGPLFNYTFAGIEPCRGARCVVFEACINKPDEGNASLLYTYYWTEQDWDVQNNGDQVPMMLDIVGTDVLMHIEFFDFRRDWMPALDELEPPVDVYCHNRVSYISQPQTVTRFFYRSERVGGIDIYVPIGENETEPLHLRTMFPQQEWYDYDRRISRTDYMPFYIVTAERRFENLTQDIMEFNQGLQYRVLPRLDACKISPINYNISWGDVVVEEDGSIHMMSPWNFEDLAEPMQYNGLHWERGMRADVWVGVKPNPTIKLNETVVWYFASPFSSDILTREGRDNPELPTLAKVPIKLEKYLNLAEGLPHVVYHIYGYEGIIPMTQNHDISLCYSSDQMRHFTFDLPPDALNSSLYLRENLKYAIQGSLQEAGNVSPLRINRMEINETDGAVTVLFTLLEKPSLVADVSGDGGENTMDAAADAIRKTIDDSQLIILVKYGNTPDPVRDAVVTTMSARPGTMTEVERGNGQPQRNEVLTGYSSGDMAGLAVGMIVLGCLLGFGGMYFYAKRK